MAVIGKIVLEKDLNSVNLRKGDVVADVVISKEYFQIRTYAFGDEDRTNGSKQNIQLDKVKALEVRNLLNKFLER